MNQMSAELPGLKAKLDRIVYYHDDRQLPCDAPHAFIYFITISNLSDTTVTLKGRRWVVREESGHQQVIESEGIVGKEPTIAPGEIFQYNSYHMTHCNCLRSAQSQAWHHSPIFLDEGRSRLGY